MPLPDWVRVAAAVMTMAVPGLCCAAPASAVVSGQMSGQISGPVSEPVSGQISAPAEFERELALPALSHPQSACAVLDGEAASFAARGMTLWAGTRPVPFALTVNSPDESAGSPAKIENFQSGHGSASFDLMMPARSYSSVTLDLSAPGAASGAVWRARLTVPASGLEIGRELGREIGRYVLFDLSKEGGPASTTMKFAERNDGVLHVSLDHALNRSELRGAWVAPSRSEQTLFTAVAVAAARIQGKRTLADFTIAQGVPVERVAFKISGAEEFRRRVTITAMPLQPGAAPDTVEGTIQQIHAVRDGAALVAQDFSVPAVLPDNASSAMRVRVAVDNGGQPPLPVRAVELQMRQREICFTAWPGAGEWRLFYGSPTMDFTSLGGPPHSLVERENPVVARLGREKLAADFHPLAIESGSPRRVFWLVVAVLALAAILLALFLRIARIPHVRR